jgi:chromosome segregation ATPase
MEIRIKTAEEFQAAHVTIEIKAADQAEAEAVAERLYTDGEVASLQSSEAELVAGPLQARINDLEDQLVKSRVRVNELEGTNTRLVRDRDALRRRIVELEAERERSADNHNTLADRVTELEADLARVRDDRQMVLTQRDNALTRVGELDREVRMAQQSTGARDRLLETATTKIENARGILTDPEVTRACERIASRGITFLSREISKAIDALA